MPVNKEKQRVRWLMNKRAARARLRVKPAPTDPLFEALATIERDRRVKDAHRGAWCWPEYNYLTADRLARAIELAADVWLAITLHEARYRSGAPTTAQICRWLEGVGRTSGYSKESLRKTVPKARERVHLLETHGGHWRPDVPSWAPFKPDLKR